MEYMAEAPLSPLNYGYLVPDLVLSYSPKADTHIDLVILRFGRAEQKYNELEKALRGVASIRVQNLDVFKNKKNANRLQYLKNAIFPRMGTLHDHHGLRKWNIKDATKGFDGMLNFLKHLEENDISKTKWSAEQFRKAAYVLSKYHLTFTD
jgi:hypothetical protein